jgi:hypothetical protein
MPLRDRAAVTWTAILQLVLSSSAPAAAGDPVQALLRDQFAEVQRQAMSDRDLNPDA